jgi:hypothetical protein
MSGRRLIAAAFVALMACSSADAAEGPGADRPLVVVLFDVSRSTQADGVRQRYLDGFARVLDFAQAQGATVVGDVIDENPLAHASYPVQGTFDRECDPLTKNPLVCEAGSARVRDALVASASAVLEPVERPAGTDVRGAALVAARVFASYPEAGERYLVLFSDMVEHAAWSEGAGPAPDLSGVEVYVVGAGASGGAMDAERILTIQRSWQAFFEEAGATLPDERYGAALVRFP